MVEGKPTNPNQNSARGLHYVLFLFFSVSSNVFSFTKYAIMYICLMGDEVCKWAAYMLNAVHMPYG